MSRMVSVLRCAIVVGLLAACGKSPKPADEAGTAPASAAAVVVDAAPAAAVAPPIDAAEESQKLRIPDDVPPFGKTATADRTKSDAFVEGFLERLVLGLPDEIDPEMFEAAVAAVRADPGSPMARYVLACVARDDAAALTLLEPLSTAPSCPECVDALRNMGGDNCTFGDATMALARKVTPSKQRLAAEAIVGAIGSRDPSKVRSYFKAAKTEWIMDCYSMCDDATDTRKKMSGAKLLDEVTVAVKKQVDEHGFGGIDTGGAMTCAADCCSVVSGMVQHNMDFLRTICFAKGTDQVRSIRLKTGG
jgi:hypothetical protein